MTPEELYLANEKLVYYVFNMYPLIQVDEDLTQIARIGLWNACLHYNGSAAFSTYAVKCIVSELSKEFAKQTRQKRVPFYSCVSNCSTLDGDNIDLVSKLMGDTDVCWMDIEGFYNSLDGRRKKILHYLLEGYTQQEISEMLGLCKSGIWADVKKIRQAVQNYI